MTPEKVLENILDITSDESGEDTERESEEEVELDDVSSEDTSEEEVTDARSGNHMGRDGNRWTVLSRDEGRCGQREQRIIFFSGRIGRTRVCHGIETTMDI